MATELEYEDIVRYKTSTDSKYRPGLSDNDKRNIREKAARYVLHHQLLYVVEVDKDLGTEKKRRAIAFAYHAVVGDNLAVITFDQSQIREHLAHCYQEKKLSPFPQRPIQRRPRKLRTLSIEMHCQCGRPDSMQDMIGCDSCNRWFHLNCGNVTSVPVDDCL